MVEAKTTPSTPADRIAVSSPHVQNSTSATPPLTEECNCSAVACRGLETGRTMTRPSEPPVATNTPSAEIARDVGGFSWPPKLKSASVGPTAAEGVENAGADAGIVNTASEVSGEAAKNVAHPSSGCGW